MSDYREEYEKKTGLPHSYTGDYDNKYVEWLENKLDTQREDIVERLEKAQGEANSMPNVRMAEASLMADICDIIKDLKGEG